MASDQTPDVTRLLEAARDGGEAALRRVLPLIYDELHRMARAQRRRQGGGETLNTTALVHEAYLKLIHQEDASWENRRHFFCVAARAMRHILVDDARRRKALKRGGDRDQVDLKEELYLTDKDAAEVLALDEALDALATLDERQSQVVELRYFVGFTIPEVADALGISEATVKRDWTMARAWLYDRMRDTS